VRFALKYKAGAAAWRVLLSFPRTEKLLRVYATARRCYNNGRVMRNSALHYCYYYTRRTWCLRPRWFVAAAARTKELEDDDDDSILLSLVL
jgi:hypothetical protein